MTPKEKADELITKYHTSRDANDWDDVRDVFAARRCALIAVKFAEESQLNTDEYNKYLGDIINEINKL